MARIVFADDGIEFDGRTLESKPLGGVESSVIFMMEELAKRDHEVIVRNMCKAPMVHKGVDWAPLHQGGEYSNIPEEADLFIANRGHRVLNLMPKARRVAFWTHNPAQYMLKWRYLWRLWKVRPTIVFIGEYHATTLPSWVPDGGRKVIPYGMPDIFRTAEPVSENPPKRAVFTSNPLRSLDWLLDIWESMIFPNAKDAELHVFSGAATYGAAGDAKAVEMKKVLDRAESLKDKGVVLRGPVPKQQLIEELRQARMMLYRGDLNETYCLAVGEAQALGVPAVVQDLGSMYERVRHGETGFVAKSDKSFAEGAISLFNDEEMWQRFRKTALDKQRNFGWPEAAAEFERLLP